jgi:hypothetical protein
MVSDAICQYHFRTKLASFRSLSTLQTKAATSPGFKQNIKLGFQDEKKHSMHRRHLNPHQKDEKCLAIIHE